MSHAPHPILRLMNRTSTRPHMETRVRDGEVWVLTMNGEGLHDFGVESGRVDDGLWEVEEGRLLRD